MRHAGLLPCFRYRILLAVLLERDPAMYIARVFGNVISTIKHPFFAGRRLMLVERLRLEGGADARYDIAVDLVQAGPGDVVLVLDEGNSARQLLDAEPDGPVRAVIIGIVDAVDLAGAV